ncbi:hypothetical protein ACFS7Z_08630 [Pontibacter toksunensis]|uniref:Uncharacterized protein n=1 Tax=Pontibacter toksunensis TaxID=1332631 RepID=A0ABW6BSB1_9BACT
MIKIICTIQNHIVEGWLQQREVGGVYYALLNDFCNDEIANPMEDVKLLIEQAEGSMLIRINDSI